jgi:hypothetical protein
VIDVKEFKARRFEISAERQGLFEGQAKLKEQLVILAQDEAKIEAIYRQIERAMDTCHTEDDLQGSASEALRPYADQIHVWLNGMTDAGKTALARALGVTATFYVGQKALPERVKVYMRVDFENAPVDTSIPNQFPSTVPSPSSRAARRGRAHS